MEPGFITNDNDTTARALGRRTVFASDMPASRPIEFDLGYVAFGLASVSHCGLGGIGLLNKFVPRPLLAWGVCLTSKLPLRPDQPVGGGIRLWLDLVNQSPRRYERFLAIR